MVQSVIVCADRASADALVSVPVARVCCDLLELLSGVPDGRSGRGRDHPPSVVLALAAAAVVAGNSGFASVWSWVEAVPVPIVMDLYLRAGALPVGAPSRSTLWRVLTFADVEALDRAVGTWLTSNLRAWLERAEDGTDPEPVLMQVRMDGKAVRGAKDADGNQLHLLSALVGPVGGPQIVAAQTQVGVKSNEVPLATTVLDQIDLTGAIVTADALHTVKKTAEHIRASGGDYVLPVKQNRQHLFDQIDALPWPAVPVTDTQTDRGHGRITTRTLQVLPAPPGLPFPDAAQVYLLERHVTTLSGTPVSAIAQLGVTSLPPERITATDLARIIRDHWKIEVLHWIRDTLYQEDKSKIRTRSGPRVLATLRNLAIGAFKLLGRNDTTEATRWASHYIDRPFTVLDLNRS